MAGVEEVRAGISMANQKMQEGVAALQQTALVLEEAQSALSGAIEGTAQDDVQHAYGMLAEVLQTLTGAQGTLSATISSTESYAGRL
ncbi:hypothetical protein EIL87_15095 [Saccharopolyspora rhizosphaerae]|uniref:Uncharacterized protein n=1 Tax=Saccharopolyspora rhizosphaerae TaxID=2492662 RepID=A0A426JQJ4_9PSEU|nr:hypothetical protein [Saccharopolyspora rhizosphaerae]RRO15391.1 hypothetical protein EIL87_15095 [Saccharopolyspora rhizosphaerae]